MFISANTAIIGIWPIKNSPEGYFLFFLAISFLGSGFLGGFLCSLWLFAVGFNLFGVRLINLDQLVHCGINTHLIANTVNNLRIFVLFYFVFFFFVEVGVLL